MTIDRVVSDLGLAVKLERDSNISTLYFQVSLMKTGKGWMFDPSRQKLKWPPLGKDRVRLKLRKGR